MTDIAFSYENSYFCSSVLSGGIKVQLVFPTKDPIRVVLETRLSSSNPWSVHRNFTASGSVIVPIVRFAEGQEFRLRTYARPTSAQSSTLGTGDSPSMDDFNELSGRVDILEQSSGAAKETTWAQLKSMRENSELTPGGLYRITDYVTTVANDPEARSAGHPFDVVVLALDASTISERAWAMRSERDAEGYFSTAKVEAWQLWYCLDNDTKRFLWADDENGKGVIYRMIDEWKNDVPYDFKNVQFKRYFTNGEYVSDVVNNYDWPNTNYILSSDMDGVFGNMNIEDHDDFEWFYTFTYYEGISTVIDASLIDRLVVDFDSAYWQKACNCNEMAPYYISLDVDGTLYVVQALNNIITSSYDGEDERAVKIYGNKWGAGCFNMTLHEHCYGNTFGCNCYNVVAFKLYYNTFGNDCYNNTFWNSCSYNSFGNDCNGNSFGNYFCNNTFGNYCNSNSFGNYCYNHSFGNSCFYNSFGNYCHDNSFGNYCHDNTFGNYCYNHSFGNSCFYNSFGNYLKYITSGDGVMYLKVTGGNDYNHTVQNANIQNGTSGGNSQNKLTVTLPELSPVCRYVGLNSYGELKIWVPADLV